MLSNYSKNNHVILESIGFIIIAALLFLSTEWSPCCSCSPFGEEQHDLFLPQPASLFVWKPIPQDPSFLQAMVFIVLGPTTASLPATCYK